MSHSSATAADGEDRREPQQKRGGAAAEQRRGCSGAAAGQQRGSSGQSVDGWATFHELYLGRLAFGVEPLAAVQTEEQVGAANAHVRVKGGLHVSETGCVQTVHVVCPVHGLRAVAVDALEVLLSPDPLERAEREIAQPREGLLEGSTNPG